MRRRNLTTAHAKNTPRRLQTGRAATSFRIGRGRLRLRGEPLEGRDLLSLNLVHEQLSTAENRPLTITPSQLVAGDADGSIALRPYFQGDLSLPGNQPANAKLVANADGTYTFTPNTNFTGATSFQYLVKAAVPQLELALPNGAANDGFGGNFGPQQVALSSDGNTAIVAATGINGNEQEHKVYIFARSGTSWLQQAEISDPLNDPTDYEFGRSVAVDGDTAVIGAPAYISSSSPGNVYIYGRSGGTWSLQKTLTSPADHNNGGRFGQSVAINGDTVVVGSLYGDYGEGDAWVYQRSGTNWNSGYQITPPQLLGSDFGQSVSISGGTIAVGGTSTAYTFAKDNSGFWPWQQLVTGATASFGDSVSISGNILAVGEPDGGTGGEAHVYQWSGSTWTEQQLSSAVDFASGDQYGASVSLSGNSLVVGAPGRTVNGLSEQGAAYAFTQSSDGSWAPNTRVDDGQFASEISANNGQHYDYFGRSVAAAGDTFLIGCPGHTVTESSQGAAYIQEAPWGVATANVTVSPPSPPVARNDVYVLGNSSTVAVNAANGILSNDSDPAGLPIHFNTGTPPSHGYLLVQPDGSFTYSPNSSFPGWDQITYNISDGSAISGSASVTFLSHTAATVWKFYESMLDRAPDSQGLTYWINAFNNGAAQSQIAVNFFAGNELQARVITDYYLQYLNRQPDLGGLNYWKAQWTAQGGPEDVQAGFANSPEFTAQNGNTPSGWVTGLYQKILNRAPEAQGLAFWSSEVEQFDAQDGKSFLGDADAREKVAAAILKSQEEYQNIIVPAWFEQFVQRAPTAAELTQYVNELLKGTSDRTVEEQIIDNAGVAADVPSPASGTAMALPNFYYVPLVEQTHAAANGSVSNAATANANGSSPSQAVAAKDALFADLGD